MKNIEGEKYLNVRIIAGVGFGRSKFINAFCRHEKNRLCMQIWIDKSSGVKIIMIANILIGVLKIS